MTWYKLTLVSRTPTVQTPFGRSYAVTRRSIDGMIATSKMEAIRLGMSRNPVKTHQKLDAILCKSESDTARAFALWQTRNDEILELKDILG
jgi:hypothetical protein